MWFRRLSEAKQRGNFCAEGKLRENLRAESERALPLGRATRAPKSHSCEALLYLTDTAGTGKFFFHLRFVLSLIGIEL